MFFIFLYLFPTIIITVQTGWLSFSNLALPFALVLSVSAVLALLTDVIASKKNNFKMMKRLAILNSLPF